MLLRSQPPLAIFLRRTSPTDKEGDIAPLISTIRGFAKALILVLATFICASLWGNDLAPTLVFVVAVTAIVTVSRLFSIAALGQLQEVFQLTIVEYGNEAERRGLHRLLAAMPGVVVSKNQHELRYTAGHNVDIHRCDQWTEKGLVLLLKIAVTVFYFLTVGTATLPLVLALAAIVLDITWFPLSRIIISSLWVLLFLCPIGWAMWRYLGDIWNTYLVDLELETSEAEIELDQADDAQLHI